MNRSSDPAFAFTEQSKVDYPPPPRATSPIQAVQGGYYIIAGLLVAFGLVWLQSTTSQRVNIANLWPLRICAGILAVYGVGLVYAARRREALGWATWGAVIAAILVTSVDVLCMTIGVFPLTFLVDVTLELGFLVWWLLAIAFGVRLSYYPERGVNRVDPQT